MKQLSLIAARLVLTCTLAGLSVGPAYACGGAAASAEDYSSPASMPAAEEPSSPTFIPAVYRAGLASTDSDPSWSDRSQRSPIVGLWEFEVRLDGAQNGLPDKALFDWGLAQWHADGTEFQISGLRAGSAGDVCMGAWRQHGSEFVLRHIGIGLTPGTATGTFVGPGIIRAAVTVDGNIYKGWYTLATYAGSPANGTEFNESGKPLFTFKATIRQSELQPPDSFTNRSVAFAFLYLHHIRALPIAVTNPMRTR